VPVATDWVLTVDLRQDRGRLQLGLGLFDRDRSHCWQETRAIREDVFREIVESVRRVFDVGRHASERRADMELFSRLADRTFQVGQFLKSTGLADGDSLAINTIVTSIPWDLVPHGGEILGHRISVGLKIPTPRASEPTGAIGEGRPRFLHVVSNPGDLQHAADEIRELEQLVGGIGGLDYHPLPNPTRSELIKTLNTGRTTRFLHFTGHVQPGLGLLLKDGALEVEEIIQYFSAQRDQLVFLNGCDAAYGSQHGIEPDLFQAASVANAFLDAGAEAVIAPRSLIADADAWQAAKLVWEQILVGGKSAAAAVRGLRRELVKQQGGALASYSYILYGDPGYRPSAREVRGVSSPATDATVLEHELVRAAAIEAGGTAAPRHLFAALTRHWLVGGVYFALEGQRYILALEELRARLGVARLGRQRTDVTGDVTPAARLVLRRAVARADTRYLDELALLEAIAEVADPEIRCALEALEVGPRTLDALVRQARQLGEHGAQAPTGAGILPSGLLNPDVFLPEERFVGAGVPSATDVNPWDLFAALARRGRKLSALVSQAGIGTLPAAAWTAGEPLAWMQLTDSAREIVGEAILMMENEHDRTVFEGRLAFCLASSDGLLWARLPEAARAALGASGQHERTWPEFLRQVKLKSLAWS
jgi:hypothetical protein